MRFMNVALILFGVVSIGISQEHLDDHGNVITFTSDPDYVNNQIIVRFKVNTVPPSVSDELMLVQEGTSSLPQNVNNLLSSTGASTIKKIFVLAAISDTVGGYPDLTQFFLVTFPDTIDVPDMVSTYQSSTIVSYAQPNFRYHTQGNPGDPLFSTQWGLEQTTNIDIDAEIAWRIQTGSSNIKIGIFDTGIDYTHDDLGNNLGSTYKIAGGYDYVNQDTNPFDDRFHGTHVAGIAGAMTNNTKNSALKGISGIAGGWGYNANSGSGNSGAKIYAMKVGDASGNIYAAEVAPAIIEATMPGGGYDLNVLNLSYGQLNWYDEIDRVALACAVKNNKVIVASKGNFGVNTVNYPSDYDGNWIISVGALNSSGGRATKINSFGWPDGQDGSNYGNGMDFLAPGELIKSTTPVTQNTKMYNLNIAAEYHSLTGTSFAAPIATGVAALLLSMDPTLHCEDVQGIMDVTAIDIGDPGYDEQTGYGRLNAGRALRALQDPNAIKRYAVIGGTSVGNSSSYLADIWNIVSNGGYLVGRFPVVRYDIRKQVTFEQTYPSKPYVWGRGVNWSTGLSGRSPIYNMGYCNVTSVTTTGAELQTYVYKVFDEDGVNWVWYPVSPSNVQFAYTVMHPNITPAPPGDLHVTNTSGLVNLSWTHDGENVSQYQVERKVNSTNWTLAGTTQSTSYTDNTTRLGMGSDAVQYRVRAKSSYNFYSLYSNTTQITGKHTSPEKKDEALIPLENVLSQNHPNPFNPSTNIDFGLKEQSFVTINVFNSLGQKVASLGNKEYPSGYHSLTWDASKFSSGIYFYTIET